MRQIDRTVKLNQGRQGYYKPVHLILLKAIIKCFNLTALQVYRNWLQQQPARLDWDRWLMMGLIGFSVGILGFLLHQIIDLISEVKWEQTQEYIQVGTSSIGWCLTV